MTGADTARHRSRRTRLLLTTSTLSLIAALSIANAPAWAAGKGGAGGVFGLPVGGDGGGVLAGDNAYTPATSSPGNPLPFEPVHPAGALGVSVTVNVTSLTANGGDGPAGIYYLGGGGGGGSGGGAGATVANGLTITTGLVKGGSGGDGGNSSADAGGGGGGGDAIVFLGAGSLTNNGGITGGKGGVGSFGYGAYGSGGGGGFGVVFIGTGLLTNSGTITGGAGGAAALGPPAAGGDGGDAIVFLQGGSLINSGTITGGDGAFSVWGTWGRGGSGVTGSNLTIVNSGSISRGWLGDNAITFTGGVNSLELQAGYSIVGFVVGTGGDKLILGGDTTPLTAFDLSQIAPTSLPITQYRGFSAFQKTGASTWTLTGSTGAVMPWTISAGTLSISADANLGAASGGITFDGGTLQTTATFSSARAITLNAGGTFQVDPATTLTLSGVIGGAGGLIKTGAGTLTLTGNSTYTGATAIAAGTLVLASAASITSNVTNAATFQNSGTVTGTVTNSNTFDNNAAGTVSGRLTNTAGTTTNAGALNGGVTVSGGTFTQIGGSVSGGLTNAATANANGGAINGAIANNAGTFNIGGTVTSNSTFDNASGATLAIGAAGNYTLQGLLTNGGAITVASGGQLDATGGGITNAAGGSLTVALGGTVKDDLNNAGMVANNGTYLADVATNTGTITNNNIWTGNVASSAGTITNNLTWNGAITTSGTFNNSAGAMVTGLVTNSGTGSNAGTLSGGLTNTGGTFNNSGTIAGATTVSGGTLFGTGSVGTLNIAYGGTFAPGDGTAGTSTNVAGSLAFASGAIYLVQVNPTTSSFSTVTGTATLGGATVRTSFAPGSYVEKQYTILTAGSISGTFNPIVANSGLPSGFSTTLSYDGTHAYLDLALFVAPPGTGLSGNQQKVGNVITNFFNSNGGIPIVFGSLTPAGLTQLSGELGSGSQQTTFNAMSQFMGLLTDPLMGRGNGINVATSAPGYAEESASAYAASRKPKDALAMFTKAPPVPFVPRWSVWAAGYGGSQTTNGNAVAGSNDTRSSIFGTAVRADYLFSPNTLAGFALAGGGTNFSVNNLGSGRSDLFQAGAYLRHTNGAAYVTAALAYGWQDITTNRAVTVAGLDQLRAEFNANAYSGRLEGGYRFVAPWIGGVGLTPYAAAQFTTFDLPAYAESVVTGAPNFALAYSAKSVTDPRSELGIRSDKSLAMADGILTLRGRLAWAHDFNPDRTIGATFQSLPGASLVVNGAAQASESALTTASAEMKWTNGWSAAASFEGEFSNVTRSYAGKGVVRYQW
ncbi:Uncharacterized conserved protein, contains a C-terminal beta-barrel porin domain [Bradyrhizobium sp. Rc2d]|uniref:autotransporter domain-containing protein n=1 Tax=Bradyrhizobium sp. Rc2d TaxID=1855321 RepID=UPI00088C5B1F|nr:autotransporter domain-containing protein [Bradyrhizobium sp. Rc2d]SDJ83718.1 Uncharacterized conserved protein, contains a C-terminal beta-barrel porin domain [Bradyrhizobium sp. Rc2d]